VEAELYDVGDSHVLDEARCSGWLLHCPVEVPSLTCLYLCLM
jgi:hypothetical protein